MLPFPKFESSVIQKKALFRGKTLFESEGYDRLDDKQNGIWEVYFPSERSHQEFKVSLSIQDGWLEYVNCPCYSPQGPLCEHSFASLYLIRSYLEKEISKNKISIQKKESYNNEEEKKFRSEDQISSESSTSREKTQIEEELECQVCLNILIKPVLLPCHSHSLCYTCFKDLIQSLKKKKEANKELFCPTCGINSAVMKFIREQDLKVNQELDKFIQNYNRERRAWKSKKKNMEAEITTSKSQNENSQISRRIKIGPNENKQKEIEEENQCLKEDEESEKSITIKVIKKEREHNVYSLDCSQKHAEESLSFSQSPEKKKNSKRKYCNFEKENESDCFILPTRKKSKIIMD